jgi:ABC-type nitrate/sulfonate/bicarbonate transport system permease component
MRGPFPLDRKADNLGAPLAPDEGHSRPDRAFRITASVALLLVVSAEMIGAEFGIGAFVLQAGNLMQTDQLLAGVVILSLFGLAVGRLINLLETRLLHWR